MATVPNWIAKALVLTPAPRSIGRTEKTTGWRATRTQVIVTLAGGREERFHLDTLIRVGSSQYSLNSPRLVPPDSAEALAADRSHVARKARNDVLNIVGLRRLQDNDQSAEQVTESLLAIKAVVDQALADLSEVL